MDHKNTQPADNTTAGPVSADSQLSEPAVPLKKRILQRIVIFLIKWFQLFTLATSKRINLGEENLKQFTESGRSFIFAIFHANVYFSPILYRGLDVYVLISKSKDGDMIDRIVKSFGNKSIRGSTSRGGSAALRQMIKAAKSGGRLAFTPDGPRGPAFKVQPGVIGAAAACRVPVIPAHYESTRQKVAGSWDSHRVPLPFGKIVVSFGEPVEIPSKLKEEEFEYWQKVVEEKMLENMKRAEDYRDSLKKK